MKKKTRGGTEPKKAEAMYFLRRDSLVVVMLFRRGGNVPVFECSRRGSGREADGAEHPRDCEEQVSDHREIVEVWRNDGVSAEESGEGVKGSERTVVICRGDVYPAPATDFNQLDNKGTRWLDLPGKRPRHTDHRHPIRSTPPLVSHHACILSLITLLPQSRRIAR